jgi:hypothetical protein
MTTSANGVAGDAEEILTVSDKIIRAIRKPSRAGVLILRA